MFIFVQNFIRFLLAVSLFSLALFLSTVNGKKINIQNPKLDVALMYNQAVSMYYQGPPLIAAVRKWVKGYYEENRAENIHFAIIGCVAFERKIFLYLNGNQTHEYVDQNLDIPTYDDRHRDFLMECAEDVSTKIFNETNGDRPDAPNVVLLFSTLSLYDDSRYWNPDLAQNFPRLVSSVKNTSGYAGFIFFPHTYHPLDVDLFNVYIRHWMHNDNGSLIWFHNATQLTEELETRLPKMSIEVMNCQPGDSATDCQCEETWRSAISYSCRPVPCTENFTTGCSCSGVGKPPQFTTCQKYRTTESSDGQSTLPMETKVTEVKVTSSAWSSLFEKTVPTNAVDDSGEMNKTKASSGVEKTSTVTDNDVKDRNGSLYKTMTFADIEQSIRTTVSKYDSSVHETIPYTGSEKTVQTIVPNQTELTSGANTDEKKKDDDKNTGIIIGSAVGGLLFLILLVILLLVIVMIRKKRKKNASGEANAKVVNMTEKEQKVKKDVRGSKVDKIGVKQGTTAGMSEKERQEKLKGVQVDLTVPSDGKSSMSKRQIGKSPESSVSKPKTVSGPAASKSKKIGK